MIVKNEHPVILKKYEKHGQKNSILENEKISRSDRFTAIIFMGAYLFFCVIIEG